MANAAFLKKHVPQSGRKSLLKEIFEPSANQVGDRAFWPPCSRSFSPKFELRAHNLSEQLVVT